MRHLRLDVLPTDASWEFSESGTASHRRWSPMSRKRLKVYASEPQYGTASTQEPLAASINSSNSSSFSGCFDMRQWFGQPWQPMRWYSVSHEMFLGAVSGGNAQKMHRSLTT